MKMRKWYSHTKPIIKQIWIQNRFSYSNSHSNSNKTTIHLADNDDNNMDFQYNYEGNNLFF